MITPLPTIQEITDVMQICKAAIAYAEQVQFLTQITRELETANAQLQAAIVDGERQITRLQRELADARLQVTRAKADTKRSRNGQRRLRRGVRA